MPRPATLLTFATLCALYATSQVASAQLNGAEKKGLADALYVGNLTEQDLKFERKDLADPYRLPINAFALDNPLDAADRLLRLHSNASGSLHAALVDATKLAYDVDLPQDRELPTLGPLPEEVPEALREPLEILIGGIDESNQAVHTSISKLSGPERRELIEGLPVWCAANRSAHFGFTQKAEVSQDRMLSLLSQVDLNAIRAAGAKLSFVVESELPELKKLSSQIHLEKPLRFVIHGYRIELGTEDNAIHASRDTNLFIGFGDRNHYTGRFGAGIGYSSVLIDCGNQSYYDVPDLSVGAGVLGVGLAYATGEGDVFKGGSVCFGAGLAGVGGLVHVGNDASFRSTALSQGFGCFGEGLLIDTGDRDNFNGELFCQGAARTQGVGWLIEQGVNDTYTAGGLSTIEDRKAAISASQGFSSGFGSDDILLSGGLGLVTTTGAGQTYVAGLRAQGVSLWGGVASICDSGSRATHTASQEAQGYANHEAAAYVFNLGGYGSYTTKFGTCESCASDSSVAFLLDRGGHNLYGSHDGRPSTSLRNSLAIFLNAGAGDAFTGEPASADSTSATSLGLFCDLGANTTYCRTADFSPIKVTEGLSIFMQAVSPTGDPVSPTERLQRFTSGSAPNPGDAAMAAIWERAKGYGADALGARRQLIAIGAPAAEFVLRTELGAWNPAAAPAIGQVFDEIGDDARKLLALDIASSSGLRQQNALRIACLAPGPGLNQAIAAALAKPELQRLASRAAGLCKDRDAVGPLQPLCASSDPILALNAMVALGQIGEEACTGTASACLTSRQWPMRRAAIAAICRFPDPAIAAASGLIASADPQQRRTGIEVLIAMNTDESYRRLGRLLEDPSPDIQLQALIGLQGHIPQNLRQKIADLQQSPSPFVRRLAEGIQIDR